MAIDAAALDTVTAIARDIHNRVEASYNAYRYTMSRYEVVSHMIDADPSNADAIRFAGCIASVYGFAGFDDWCIARAKSDGR